jgi:diguanylate cyclase (GGDEF)-like protein
MDQWSYPFTPGQPRDAAWPAPGRPAALRPDAPLRLRGYLPESEYRSLFKKVDWGVAVLEAAEDGKDFVFVDINPTLERNSRLQRDFLLGQHLTGVFPASARVGLLERLRRTWESGEAEQGPAETEIALHAKGLGPYQIQRLPSGRLAVIFYGQSRRPEMEGPAQEPGFFDPLTKLPNRQLLLDRLQQALAASQRARLHGALIFVDLDNFKALNDTRGHDVGDKLLVEVARRLQVSVREVDTVARFGGDEFVVLLKNLSPSPDKAGAECEDVAVKILANLNQPYLLAGQDYWCSASLGITLFEGKGIGSDELLKRADIAMYQAKAAGRNRLRFFDPAMQAAVHERAMLEAELRRAIERRELKLRYQPQVDAAGRMVGAEALVYWQHPGRGVLYARDFIPLAEETGLIQQIGQQVLRLACNQLVDWRHYSAMARLPLSVNISNRQFRQANFVAQVRSILDSTGADPRLLRLELTEELIFQNFEDTRAKMQALQAIGVSFSLDDFGTGFSSLAQFKQLRLDQVKIDQSFVQNFGIDAGDAAVTRSVIALGSMFGIPVIAEGVETAAQRDFLFSQGCSALQGYFFGAPVPHETFMATYA